MHEVIRVVCALLILIIKLYNDEKQNNKLKFLIIFHKKK